MWQGDLRPHRDLLASSLISRLPLGMAGVGLVSIALGRGLGAGSGGSALAATALGMAAASHGLAATAMVTSVPADEAWKGAATMAIWGVGSLVGGAIHLTRQTAASPRGAAIAGFLAFSVIAFLIASASPARLVPTWGLVLLLGLPIAPSVSAVFQAARMGVPADRHVEVFAMLNSVNLGSFALGSIVGGWAVQSAGGAVPAFLLAGTASLGAALAVAVTWTQPEARRASSVASPL